MLDDFTPIINALYRFGGRALSAVYQAKRGIIRNEGDIFKPNSGW